MSIRNTLAMVTLAVFVLPATAAESVKPATSSDIALKDTESAKHGFEAAKYQLIDTYSHPGFKVVQYELSVLSHFSYLLISDHECLVVDPGRDVDVYLKACEDQGVTIKGVYLTHSHADFVAGHIELASRLEVPIYVSAKSGAEYECELVKDGDTIEIGQAVVKFLDSPGHTPDGTVALISSKEKPASPAVLLSGDTLFIGSVGRPDLLGGDMAASTLASMMFDTWYGKLSKLPDTVQILPAHGAGSLCGAHLSDEPTSTIGAQRTANPYLRYKDRGEFIASILEGLPQAPQYFGHNAALNRKGPPLVDWEPKELPFVEPIDALTDIKQYYVADIRDADAYAAGHIPNSVNIGIRGRFETWVGIMVPWDARLIVCGDNDEELAEAIHRLHRVGYQPECIKLGTWKSASQSMAQNAMTEPDRLYAAMQTSESPVIVDVRLPAEWMALRVGATVNLPLNELSEKSITLDREQQLVTVCNSAYRSSMAVGVLQREGFVNVSNMKGGSQAWIDAGLPVYEAKQEGVTATTSKREVNLADRISAAELKRMMMDMPSAFQLVDVRPAEHFADYSIPGSEYADLADILDNPSFLTGVGPLVIVDRDGSVAMMVAGILSQKTQRNVKALYGGVQAYWSESDVGSAAQPMVSPSRAIPSTSPRPRTPAPSTSVTPQPTSKPKRRSAGC